MPFPFVIMQGLSIKQICFSNCLKLLGTDNTLALWENHSVPNTKNSECLCWLGVEILSCIELDLSVCCLSWTKSEITVKSYFLNKHWINFCRSFLLIRPLNKNTMVLASSKDIVASVPDDTPIFFQFGDPEYSLCDKFHLVVLGFPATIWP